MKKSKVFIIAINLILFLFLISGSVFAYFYASHQEEVNINYNSDAIKTISINNSDDFYKYVDDVKVQEEYLKYNIDKKVSTIRNNLVLNINI